MTTDINVPEFHSGYPLMLQTSGLDVIFSKEIILVKTSSLSEEHTAARLQD